MGPKVSCAAEGLLHGVVGSDTDENGWTRPQRFTAGQLKALGSCRAWHPGLYRQLAAATAGVSLQFETDSSNVWLEAEMDPMPRGSAAVVADVERYGTGVTPPYDGFSADVDDAHLPLALPDEGGLVSFCVDVAESPEPGVQRLPGMGGASTHRVTIWLPCLGGCEVRSVMGDGTFIEPVAERGQLLVLGDSIAQGYVTCDPGLAWPCRLAAQLGLDLLNQGVGGQVFQPGTLVGMAGAVRPEHIVVEFGANYRFEPCQAGRVEQEVRTYLYEVAATWPEVPTWVMTTLPYTEVAYPNHPRSCFAEVDAIIRRCAARHGSMRVVDGSALLDAGDLARLLADGSDHPGAAGQAMLADRLGFAVVARTEDEPLRRERALSLLSRSGEKGLPLVETLRRGVGEVLLAQRGCVLLRATDGMQMLWATNRKLARQAVRCLGGARVTCLLGSRTTAADVARELGAEGCEGCLSYSFRGVSAPLAETSRDIRVLTAAYEGQILEHYAHPEYLEPGELARALEGGRVLGGFEDGRLCAFVGEHAEGSIGLLEVFEGSRRRGWGQALLAAKVAQQLDEGVVPWAEVWPENKASRSLMEKAGFSCAPADGMWFIS